MKRANAMDIGVLPGKRAKPVFLILESNDKQIIPLRLTALGLSETLSEAAKTKETLRLPIPYRQLNVLVRCLDALSQVGLDKKFVFASMTDTLTPIVTPLCHLPPEQVPPHILRLSIKEKIELIGHCIDLKIPLLAYFMAHHTVLGFGPFKNNFEAEMVKASPSQEAAHVLRCCELNKKLLIAHCPFVEKKSQYLKDYTHESILKALDPYFSKASLEQLVSLLYLNDLIDSEPLRQVCVHLLAEHCMTNKIDAYDHLEKLKASKELQKLVDVHMT